MAMIATCDFMTNLDTNMLNKNIKQTIKSRKISEFQRAQDFEQYLKEFCDTEMETILILQFLHDNVGKSLNHFIQISHLIEKIMITQNMIENNNKNVKSMAEQPNLNDSNNTCYIVLLVHLRRDTFSEAFPLVFCKQWHTYFVDSLLQKQPFNLQTFANDTCLTVFQNSPYSVSLYVFYFILFYFLFVVCYLCDA